MYFQILSSSKFTGRSFLRFSTSFGRKINKDLYVVKLQCVLARRFNGNCLQITVGTDQLFFGGGMENPENKLFADVKVKSKRQNQKVCRLVDSKRFNTNHDTFKQGG